MYEFRTGRDALKSMPPLSSSSLVENQPNDLGMDFQSASGPLHNDVDEAETPGSVGNILQNKRSLGALLDHSDSESTFENDCPESGNKRICPHESKLPGKRHAFDEEESLRYETAALETQLRKTQKALDEEKEKMTASRLRSKLCGESFSGSLDHAEQLDPPITLPVEREIFLWESPFQYARLSFETSQASLIYENADLQIRMADFLHDDSLRDLKIRGRGSNSAVSCRSQVLCAISPVVRTRILSKLHCHGFELNFENLPHDTLIQLIDYAYSGRIELNEFNVLFVYSAADFLDIEFLVSAASKFLSESTERFDGVSCYKVYRFLEQHDKLELWIPMYRRRVLEQIGEVLNSAECLVDMSFEFLNEILGSDYVDFGPETEVIRALSRWISVNPSREGCLSELLLQIRLRGIGQYPHRENVTAIKHQLKSAGSSSCDATCDQQKTGSKNGAINGGFEISYTKREPSLILDIRSQKIKVLPKSPLWTFDDRSCSDRLDVFSIASDDGAFYVILENYDPGRFDLFRLNVLEHRWEHILQSFQDQVRRCADFYSVLAGTLCLVLRNGSKHFIRCLDLKTSNAESCLSLGSFRSKGISAGLSSVFFLQHPGKVTRFDARSCTLSDVKIEIPSDQIRSCSRIRVNYAGQAVLYDPNTKTQFLVCLESGRLIHTETESTLSILNQDSIVSLKLVDQIKLVDQVTVEKAHSVLNMFRDRGRSAGWNFTRIDSSISPDDVYQLACHFARALIKDLPDLL